jgi:cysteine synthase A
MNYYKDIRELIGNTPLLQLNHITSYQGINLFGKLEFYNPGGSIKDRVGLKILTAAKEQGLLKPGYTIIEATAGNTGLGLAIAAFEMGYKLKLFIPEKFSIEKQILMQALGAEIIPTPSEEGIEGAMKRAAKLGKELPDVFLPKQFENDLNVQAHRTTGKEIHDALEGNIDILVAGAGSGGTIVGIASYLKEQNPNVKIVLADPIGSILGGGTEGTYHIEGIGNHFIPKIFDASYIDEVEKISDEEAWYYAQLLGKKEGLLTGFSSGAAIAAAVKQAYKEGIKNRAESHIDTSGDSDFHRPLNIVAVLPDRGDRYFSQKLYNTEVNLTDQKFNFLFDSWSDSYDRTVYEDRGEYHEVFEGYHSILDTIADGIKKEANSVILDIGSGTGNLSSAARKLGYQVIGLEPNTKMRSISLKKYPEIPVLEGGFLNIPVEDNSLDAIISSYAFHHLTNDDKADAANIFFKKLKPDGKIIFADTIYENPEIKDVLLADSIEKQYHSLAEDLKTEYYTTQEVLTDIFKEAGFSVTYQRMNKFVWILTAIKNKEYIL